MSLILFPVVLRFPSSHHNNSHVIGRHGCSSLADFMLQPCRFYVRCSHIPSFLQHVKQKQRGAKRMLLKVLESSFCEGAPNQEQFEAIHKDVI